MLLLIIHDIRDMLLLIIHDIRDVIAHQHDIRYVVYYTIMYRPYLFYGLIHLVMTTSFNEVLPRNQAQ